MTILCYERRLGKGPTMKKIFAILSTIAVALQVAGLSADDTKIDPLLSFRMSVKSEALSALVLMAKLDFLECEQDGERYLDCAKKKTLEAQFDVREFVNALPKSYEANHRRHQFFWIANAAVVSLFPEEIRELSSLKSVVKIYLDEIPWNKPRASHSSTDSTIHYLKALEAMNVIKMHSRYSEFLGRDVGVGIVGALADRHFRLSNIVEQKLIGEGNALDVSIGTSAAGLIAADVESSEPYISVAPGARLYVAAPAIAADKTRISSLLNAIEWLTASDKKISVLVNLWGTGDTPNLRPMYEQMVFHLENANMIIIFPAGHDGPAGTIGGPANVSNFITVGAVDNAGNILRYTSRGAQGSGKPECYAPGENVFSTALNNSFSAETGTAISAALVGGLAAFAKQVNPTLSARYFRETLRKTCGKSPVDALEFMNRLTNQTSGGE